MEQTFLGGSRSAKLVLISTEDSERQKAERNLEEAPFSPTVLGYQGVLEKATTALN